MEKRLVKFLLTILNNTIRVCIIIYSNSNLIRTILWVYRGTRSTTFSNWFFAFRSIYGSRVPREFITKPEKRKTTTVNVNKYSK